MTEALVSVWNRKELDAIDEYVADDLLVHYVPHQQDVEGLDALKQSITETHTAFPDYEWAPITVVDGDDRVVVQWKSVGTHEGEIAELGIGPTNKTITEEGVTIFKVDDERVTEAWLYYDMTGPLKQLGVLPESFTLAAFLETGANLAKREILELTKGR